MSVIAEMKQAHAELAAAQGRGGAALPDRRAHGRVQPAPVPGGARHGARSRAATDERGGADPARRRPLQADQRHARPPRRRRGARRARGAAAPAACATTTPWPAGAARSSSSCCGRSTTTRRCAGSATACATRSCVEPVATSAGPLQVSASFGGVRARRRELRTAERLVEAADRALYSAKRRGRNQVRLCERADRARPDDRRARGGRPGPGAGARRRRSATACPSCTPSRWPSSPWRSPTGSALARDASCAAGSAAGCTTSARSRSPTGCWPRPGTLDEGEWALMQRHTLIGEQMVRRIPGLVEAAAAVRHHHERFDGSGYPDGLAATQIPLEARIIAAVDAFSAITNERVYGQAARARTRSRRCAAAPGPTSIRTSSRRWSPASRTRPARLRRRLAARRTDQARAA